jgi:RNA polymerase sigma factor (sigma-70 family)
MQTRLISILRHLRRVVVQRSDGGLSDAQLLERFALQRDEAAFEVLVWRHGPMVLGVGRRLLHNLHDAEDVLQATFLALARQASSISKREALGAWLHRVAFRLALRLRLQRRKCATEPLDVVNEPAAPVARSESEALAALDDEVQRLPAKYRTPLVLSYLQGLTNHDIAAELGCPIGTVFTRLARGREMLRLRLVRRGITLSGGVLATVLAETAPASTLSNELARTTVHAAATFAAGSAAAVAPHVAAMTEGVLNMMWLGKMKLVAAVLMLAIAAGSGAGLLAFRAAGREGDDVRKVAVDDQKPQAELKKPARESLRYGGKSFDEWGNTLLIDLKPEVRAEAIKAISAFGANGYAREATTIIVDTVRSYKSIWNLGDDQLVVDAAIDGVRKIGAQAVPILVKEMKRGKGDLTSFTVTCLQRFSPYDAAPALSSAIEALKIEDQNVRAATIDCLRQIDVEAKSTRAVASLVGGKDAYIRGKALDLLQSFGPKAKEAIPEIAKQAVEDDQPHVRQRSLQVLAHTKPKPQEIVPTLLKVLKETDDSSVEVREQAIAIFQELGAEGKDAVPDLIAALKKGTSIRQCMEIARVLGAIGPPAKAAVPLLTEELNRNRPNQDWLNKFIIGALNKINK